MGALGDGGAVVTNSKEVAEKIRLLRNHGQKSKREIVLYGFTSRLSNLQAAILNVKFKYLPQWIGRRRGIAKLYDKGLADIPDIMLPPKLDNTHEDVYQNYVLRAKKRDELFNCLEAHGIETLIKDPVPLHRHKRLGLSHFKLPHTERLAKEVISLPMYPELTDQQVEYVIKTIRAFYFEQSEKQGSRSGSYDPR